ncbi:hypothetical protein [Streptomyces sp. NPDC012888]|uniref:hypothetical protein n=1 Tax=Streptomyces sp. NPDC012888 TaxID=3364855 RepID=UPI0036B6E548
MAAVGTVVVVGVLPSVLSATPAHAQAILSVTKSHEGNFVRGEQGVYTVTLTNSGDTGSGALELTDNLPAGLTVAELEGNLAEACEVTNGGTTVHCDNFAFIRPGASTLAITVNVADNAPCSVTNTVTLTETTAEDVNTFSASDPTTITGGDCDEGGDGRPVLPITLHGVIPMFNNLTTNNNINSPGAGSNSRQTFSLNAS